MKVLHVVNAFSAGGMENGVANLSHGLFKRGISTGICALTFADAFTQRLHPSVIIHQIDRGDRLDLGIWASIRRIVEEHKYDVLHTHNWTGLIYGVPAALWAGIPVLHGEHAELFDWEKTPYRLALRRLAYCWCNKIHVLSQGQYSELKCHRLLEGIDAVAISNGTDEDKFCPSKRQEARFKLGLPEKGFFIGLVGRMVATKRHEFMLEAFLEAGTEEKSLHLVCVGSGGNIENKIRMLCENHPLSNRIHWLGSRDDMPTVYNSLDILAMPSVNEGMPNVALESMACGVPVLANQVCGISEIIDDGVDGFISQMIRPTILARRMLELFNEKENLPIISVRARSKILAKFSFNQMVDTYAAIYRDLSW
jgi:glycosyltransferase involved in cell wall biosynthesis